MDWMKRNLSLIVSAGAAFSVILSGFTWVHSYFARADALEYVKCISETKDESLAAQLSATAKYIEYIRHKTTLSGMSAPAMNTGMGDPDEIERKQNEAYAASQEFLRLAAAKDQEFEKCGNLLF